MNPGFGYGGMMILDVGTVDLANDLMRMMQAEKVGYVAVSLGYYKTLFSNSGRSTSAEVPEDVQRKMGLSEGLIRFSVGLDNDIEQSLMKVKICLTNLHII
jgi:methionine-gamma-lyase